MATIEPIVDELAYIPPPELPDGVYLDELAAARQRKLRERLSSADVERSVARCADVLLSGAELPLNPFPPLARLLRHEELRVELTPPPDVKKQRPAPLWIESDLQSSAIDSQLAMLKGLGAAWRPLAPLIDSDAVRNSVAGLAATQLLNSASRPVGAFTIKSACSLTGGHAFSGRVLAHPRTVELIEHVQVRGPGGRLEEALKAFAEHICVTALSLHASRECLVEEVEVYTGEGDAFDEEATADVSDGRATSGARGTPERFGLAALHARAPALHRALQAAAMAKLPVYLQVLSCVPVIVGPLQTAASEANLPKPLGPAEVSPPRWQFVAVQKAMCFFYEATSEKLKTAKSSKKILDEQEEAVQRFQPYQQQSLFQSVWFNDADASWYSKIRENKPSAEGGGSMSEARERFMGFMRGRVCHFLMQGDHLNLLEAMLYLLPDVPREERHDLLTDMRTCFASDAAVLAELAHQALVVSRVLATADGAAVPPPKRSFARSIAAKQCGYLSTAIRRFCKRATWADLEPVKPLLL